MASGLPEVDSLETYGGVKADYAPPEDETTDLAATFWNLVAMNVAGLTQTAPRAISRFVGHGTTPTDPASNTDFAVWGNSLGVKPTKARSTTGVYTLTYPTTVTDERGVTHTVNLVEGWGNANGSTLYHVQVTITAPNVATVYVFNAGGAANDAVGVTIAVFLR